MRRAVRTLRTRVGRVQREVARQLRALPEQGQTKVGDLLTRTGSILAQRTKDKNKLYALHAPEVECISKGKASAVRVRREGERRDDPEGRPSGGHAQHAGQPV